MTDNMHNDIKKIVISEDAVQKRIKELGKKISQDYLGKNFIMIGVLKGAMFFIADLMRKISIPVIIDFLGVSSYGETSRNSGIVRIIKDLEENIENRHVLIVEDIIDTGLTLGYILKTLNLRKPASIKTCVFLNKTGRRLQDINIDYLGFEESSDFYVGYGLDYYDRYRHLPFICTLNEKVLEKR